MISIFAKTDGFERLQSWMRPDAERLQGLFHLTELQQADTQQLYFPDMMVSDSGIRIAPDWGNLAPPYLFPDPLPAEPLIFRALVNYLLGAEHEAMRILPADHPLQLDLSHMSYLRYGHPFAKAPRVRPVEENEFEAYRTLHNQAVLLHYGLFRSEPRGHDLQLAYRTALEKAPGPEWKAFTARHFAIALLDSGQGLAARQLLEDMLEHDLPERARFAVQADLGRVLMNLLAVPYDTELLEAAKEHLWQALRFFESEDRSAEAGLLLLDAAQIAQISENFAEALGYLKQAADHFEKEGLEELKADTSIRRGALLSAWAQRGSPQFYQPAIQAFHQALKVFTKEHAPYVFADLHHRLGVLYAEMPDEHKKRGIWAGVASSSFGEALRYFTKEEFPYEYASICTNYGNALTRFPEALHSDNYEKALFYYQEALAIRTPEAYPYERALTLLNYLEAAWNLGEPESGFNKARFEDMVAKAREVQQLVADPELRDRAGEHLEHLGLLLRAVEKS